MILLFKQWKVQLVFSNCYRFFIASYYLEFSPESQTFIDNVNKSLITILIFWLIHQFIQPVTYLLGGLRKTFNKRTNWLDS